MYDDLFVRHLINDISLIMVIKSNVFRSVTENRNLLSNIIQSGKQRIVIIESKEKSTWLLVYNTIHFYPVWSAYYLSIISSYRQCD